MLEELVTTKRITQRSSKDARGYQFFDTPRRSKRRVEGQKWLWPQMSIVQVLFDGLPKIAVGNGNEAANVVRIIAIDALTVPTNGSGSVQYVRRIPSRPLSDFVERLWLLSDAPAHSKERIAPSGTIDLGFNLHENETRIYDPVKPERYKRFSGAVVSGTHSGPFVIDPRELVAVMGVRFRPGGAFPFLGIPASELADTHIDLEVLWGTSAMELRERLCEAKTPAERFNLLEKALVAHLFRPLERHYAVRFALDAFGRADSALAIRDVARETGLSQRRFIQVFAREVGMSPKLFCRVRRFRQALETVRWTAAPDWGRLAVDCGYYDQSHLIHDFRLFSNLSPAEYVRQRSECVFQNHATLVR